MVNTPFPKFKLTVNKVTGNCYHGYKEGDELILEDFTHPPQYFCLGLAHAVFPAIYALSFGACFPFMDNQRSLLVTCPDGGKLEFKVEVLDGLGKPQVIPKDQNYKGPQPNGSTTSLDPARDYPERVKRVEGLTIGTERSRSAKKIAIEVVKSDGRCHFGYKIGDKWETPGLKCIPGFCGAAFHTAFPALFALNFGAKFFFMENPDSIDTVACPDGGKIVFKISRVE